MDAAGYLNTRIVSADTGWEPVVSDMGSNPAYAAAVDVVGAHYPGAPPAAAYHLNKTLFASEMWNLGFVDDWAGALKLAADLSDQASWGLSASILWCLIYSWYAPLPFSRVIPGTQAGAGHSILTAAEPWSGN
jgi:galactosylceramidase